MNIIKQVAPPSASVAPAVVSNQSDAAPLELSGLVKRYGDITAVQDVSLKVESGEFLTLLGPSGSGKSTTLAMIAGFEHPTAGTIKVGDRDITRLVTHKRNLGMIFQGYALFPHMSVFDNVAFPLTLRKIAKSAIKQRVLETLEIVGLGAYARRRPSALSGGQQQRVALARAIVHRPSILLMDEPLSALDKSLRAQMQVELRRIQDELGSTVLFVTHDQEEALSLSDRIVVMNEGSIAQVGSPAEIYEHPQSRFVARFIGSAQFLNGTLAGAGSGAGKTVLRTTSGFELVGRSTNTCADGTNATAVLRPEDARLEQPAEPANAITVRVTSQIYLGDRIRCQSIFPDGTEGMVWLDHGEAARVPVGDEVTLYWPCARTIFVT